ncbi:Uncharacterised protein [uncultured archaeon]|nr:Uncharacterised protein [uncultured archaeon]
MIPDIFTSRAFIVGSGVAFAIGVFVGLCIASAIVWGLG